MITVKIDITDSNVNPNVISHFKDKSLKKIVPKDEEVVYKIILWQRQYEEVCEKEKLDATNYFCIRDYWGEDEE